MCLLLFKARLLGILLGPLVLKITLLPNFTIEGSLCQEFLLKSSLKAFWFMLDRLNQVASSNRGRKVVHVDFHGFFFPVISASTPRLLWPLCLSWPFSSDNQCSLQFENLIWIIERGYPTGFAYHFEPGDILFALRPVDCWHLYQKFISGAVNLTGGPMAFVGLVL